MVSTSHCQCDDAGSIPVCGSRCRISLKVEPVISNHMVAVRVCYAAPVIQTDRRIQGEKEYVIKRIRKVCK